MTGVEHPAHRINRTVHRFRVTGFRTVPPVGGFAVRGQGCLRTGSGVPAAGPSIIPLRIGEARRVAGVIHSRLVLSPSGSGFSPPQDISYRAVKLPSVSAAFGRFYLRCGAGLSQVAPILVDDETGPNEGRSNGGFLLMAKRSLRLICVMCTLALAACVSPEELRPGRGDVCGLWLPPSH